MVALKRNAMDIPVSAYAFPDWQLLHKIDKFFQHKYLPVSLWFSRHSVIRHILHRRNLLTVPKCHKGNPDTLRSIDLYHDPAMVTRSPLIRFVEGAGAHALMKPPRCEHVVELPTCSRRAFRCGVVGWHVLGAWR